MSMEEFEALEPKRVFNYFREISGIPKGPGNTGELSEYIVRIASEYGHEARIDGAGNVIIRCRGSAGYGAHPPIMLHGKLDMSLKKSADSRHDFSKDPLKLRIMDDYLYAAGTTLGADVSMGIAYSLALLSDPDIAHPPLEIVFTADSKLNLRGARALDVSEFHSKSLINLNGTMNRAILVSSAGRLTGTLSVPVRYRKSEGEICRIVVSGFHGGHSGIDIGSFYGNANIIMGRLLHFLNDRVPFEMISIQGGLMRNAIPRDADCKVMIPEENSDSFEDLIRDFEKTIQNEYHANERNIMIYCDHAGRGEAEVLLKKTQERVIFLLNTVPDGVQRISQEPLLKGLVETSLNIGIMRLDENEFSLEAAIRSSIISAKHALSDKLQYLSETIGGRYTLSDDYPTWEYRADSHLTEAFKEAYREECGKEADIYGIHAGYECAVFFERMPEIDIVSIGPEVTSPRSSSEKLDIASVGETWRVLLRVLTSL